MSNVERGSVWLANLNPGRGTEPGKMRPVLIIQSQILLDAGHPSTIVIPLTTNLIDNADPLRVRVKVRDGLERDSDLLMDQIRAIDNRRLVKGPLARLDEDRMVEIVTALMEIVGR